MVLRFSIFGNSYYFTFKFIGLTFLLVFIFSNLGLWQYHRAQQKRLLIQAYAERPFEKALTSSALFKADQDARFFSVKLKGHFDNQHQIFLDNKTLEGQVGYEIYTPFLIEGSQQAILIDRGWVPANRDRQILPSIQPVTEALTLKGVVNLPPSYFSLGSISENPANYFPLRVQYINVKELTPRLGLTLSPYIVWLDPADSHGFKRQWKVTLMGPEKHVMYAVQWFAFALSLLVIFGVLNLHRVKN
jgi:surfeit locus 1 family protein